MAKDKITDYSATNASNTDLGGIDIQGTGYISNGDNAIRELMTHLADVSKGTYPVADTWSFADPGDLTKIARLDCGSITTSSTRVITIPDRSGVLMTGPSTTTDNTVPRFNGTAGDIQTSSVVVSDGGLVLANSGSAANPAYSFNSGSGTDGMYLKTGSSLGWSVDGVEAMYLTSSSLFPPAQIQMASGSAANPAYTFTSGSGTDGMYLRTSTSIGFSIDGTEVGYFSSTGMTLANNNYITYGGTGAASQRTALGLGTAATQNTGTSGANVPLMNGANTWSAAQTVSLTSATVPTLVVDRTNNNGNSFMSFKTTGAEVAIGQGTQGEFAVGTTGTALTSTKYFGSSVSYFYFGNQSNNTPGISNTDTGATMDVVSGYKFRISTTSGTNLSLNVNTDPSDAADFRYQGAVKGTITVTSSNTAYNTTSDENLKNFTGTYSYEAAKAVIQADPVRSFTWKDGGEAAVGWGAQTSYAVSPDLATPGRGTPGDDDYRPWGVDQGKRTPYLWAAVSGLIDKIEALEAEIAALKAA